MKTVQSLVSEPQQGVTRNQTQMMSLGTKGMCKGKQAIWSYFKETDYLVVSVVENRLSVTVLSDIQSLYPRSCLFGALLLSFEADSGKTRNAAIAIHVLDPFLNE